MEKTQKFKSNRHEEINSIFSCKESNSYMFNKCSNFHSELFENHHNYAFRKEKDDIFNGLCKENCHSIELKFFSKLIINCAAWHVYVNLKEMDIGSILIAKYVLLMK